MKRELYKILLGLWSMLISAAFCALWLVPAFLVHPLWAAGPPVILLAWILGTELDADQP